MTLFIDHEATLFIEHRDLNQPSSTPFFLLLAEKVNQICHSVLDDKHVSYLREVLACSEVERMETVLNEFQIPQYDVRIGGIQPDSQRPGIPVSQDLLQFLDNDICNLFHDGETVAFKDPDDEKFSFMYARITRLVDSNVQLKGLLCRYKVDIGQAKPIEVYGMMLYKFCRSKQRHRDEMKLMSSVQMKQQIIAVMKHEHRLSEKERKESILRMCKHWYPNESEKAQSDFCDELFDSLQQDDTVCSNDQLGTEQNKKKSDDFSAEKHEDNNSTSGSAEKRLPLIEEKYSRRQSVANNEKTRVINSTQNEYQSVLSSGQVETGLSDEASTKTHEGINLIFFS